MLIEEIRRLEMKLMGQKPTACSACKGELLYEGGGAYRCVKCGHVELDAFGKVKKFLDTNGPAPSIVIERATGVNKKYIERMLNENWLEVYKQLGDQGKK